MEKSSEQSPIFAIKPFQIKISNNTDEKLFNVPILDSNHASNDKIRYSSGSSDMNYNDLIDSFLKEGFQIDGLFIHVFGDYNKFITRQLNQFITLEEKQLSLDNSPSKKYSFLAHLDPFQNQPNVVAVFPKKPCSLKLGKLGENEYNIFFEYLMPEVSIEVDIYPLLKLDIDK